jgi:serine/threonine protein kinase
LIDLQYCAPLTDYHTAGDANIFDIYNLAKSKAGEGNFGCVYKCNHKGGAGLFACKKVDQSSVSSKELRAMHLEIAIMMGIGHPHIVRLEEVFFGPSAAYLVMDYCEVKKAVADGLDR